jgi:predicted PurR-regulated permease PerM
VKSGLGAAARSLSPRPGQSRHEFALRAAIVLGMAVAAVAAWRLLDLLLLFYAAVLVALLFHALAEALSSVTRLPVHWSLAVVVAGSFLLLLGLVALFGVEVAHELRTLAARLPAAWHSLQARLQPLGIDPGSLDAIRARLIDGTGAAAIGEIAATALTAIGALLLALVGAAYLAAQPGTYRRGVLMLVPRERLRATARMLEAVVSALKRWLVGQLLVMVVVGLMTGLGAWAIGLPSAAALGLIAAVLEFVPYVGPILTAVPALLLAFAISAETAGLTLGLLLIVQQLEGYILTPLVQNRAVALPPALTLFSIFAMGILLGPAGVLLAAPLTVSAYVVVNHLLGRAAHVSGRKARHRPGSRHPSANGKAAE